MYKKFIEEMIKSELLKSRYSVVKFEEMEIRDTIVFFTAKCINLANDNLGYEIVRGDISVHSGFKIWNGMKFETLLA